MAKLLLPTVLIVLLALAACAEATPTPLAVPTETAAAGAPSEATPATGPVADPTPPSPRTKPPEPTETLEPTPTSELEPTATSPATETPTAAPAPTETPAPTPEPTATATPAPAPTATPAATPNPAATSGPISEPTPVATGTPIPVQNAPLWRGLTVAPEDRCSDYDAADYRYSPAVESRIVRAQGGIYGPYTGTWFDDTKETDIEHIVARSEAHDSGLCAADPDTWDRFASDLLNLTLASPSVNRHQKVAKDPSEWLPALNECWYVDRVVQVRRKYQLTIDRAEAEAIDGVLAGCQSTEMIVRDPGESSIATSTPTPAGVVDALAMYDDNGNGRITCAEARAHGIAPVHRGHPAYEFMRDADGDGVVCE